MDFLIRGSIRLIIGFACLLIYMNVLGKMQLAPTGPVDQISNYVLAALIGAIIFDLELPIWKFLYVIVLWGGLTLLLNYIKDKNLKAKSIIDGKPILLMNDGILHIQEFQKALISADDLVSMLHQKGVPSIDEVSTIWLESNGQLTIVCKGDEQLAKSVIEDGQINTRDLYLLGKDKQWVHDELAKQNIDNVSKVFLGEYKNNKLTVYLYP